MRLSPRTLLDRQRQRVDELWQRARTLFGHDMDLRREHAHGLAMHLQALSPVAILERGFAIVRRAGGDEVVSHVAQAQPGNRLQVQVSDGRFGVVVSGEGGRKRDASDDAGQLALFDGS